MGKTCTIFRLLASKAEVNNPIWISKTNINIVMYEKVSNPHMRSKIPQEGDKGSTRLQKLYRKAMTGSVGNHKEKDFGTS